MGFGDVKEKKVYSGACVSQRLVLESQYITIERDGIYLLTAVGGGGSGGSTGVTAGPRAATGGGAGGFCQRKVRFRAGDMIVVNIGAGGAGVNGGSVGAIGNDGNPTFIFLPDGAMIANGGGMGYYHRGGATGGTAPGAATVGTAVGGEVNVTGGITGSATHINNSSSIALTGGGAVGVYGVGHYAGSADSQAGYAAVTGGAGVGGASGYAIAAAAAAASAPSSACEGSVGVTDATAAIAARNNVGLTNAGGHVQSRILAPGGAPASTQSYEGAGGMSAGNVKPGMFGGSGGTNGGGSYNAGLGAGSGGCTATSGNGGDGCVVIELLEIL